jgi:hypothetical protein
LSRPESDRQEVAKLDTGFQAAVKRNDAETMAQILHPDMVLILGDGRVNMRAEQLEEALNKHRVPDPGRGSWNASRACPRRYRGRDRAAAN